MNSEILAAALVGVGHAGSGGAMMMVAVVVLIAIGALGVSRWRR